MRWAFGFAPYARVTFSSRGKSNQKRLPLPRPYAALRVPSFHRRSRGRQNGPSLARLCLSRHPCRSTPSTTTPLGLRPRGGQIKIKSQIKSRSRAPLPLPLSRKRERGDERLKPCTDPLLIWLLILILIYSAPSGGRAESLRRGLSGREPLKAKTGQGRPVLPAPGATTKRGKSQRSGDPYGGARPFGYFWVVRQSGNAKSTSRVRRETKRSANAIKQNNETPNQRQSSRTRVNPSCATEATNCPARLKMLPRANPRPFPDHGLSIAYNNQSSMRRSA